MDERGSRFSGAAKDRAQQRGRHGRVLLAGLAMLASTATPAPSQQIAAIGFLCPSDAPEPCRFMLDEVDQGAVAPGEIKTVAVMPGPHRLGQSDLDGENATAEELAVESDKVITLLGPRFRTVPGGVVDTRTPLMWATRDNGSDITWQAAQSYAANYRAGGYDDWRLPTISEARSLYESGPAQARGPCRAGPKVTASISMTSCVIWTAESRGSKGEYVYLYGGDIFWFLRGLDMHLRVLPVRSR